MNESLKEHLLYIFIISLPLLYLVLIWNTIPEEVPLSWNWQGASYDLVSKNSLWLLPIIFPIGTYLMMFFIPTRKTKKLRIRSLKAYLLLSLSILTIYIIYITKKGIQPNESHYLTLFGVVFTLFGYMLRFVNQNYVFGIRTSATLSNQKLWSDSNISLSHYSVIVGIFMVIISLLFSFETTAILIVFLSAILLLASIVFSYVWRQGLDNKKDDLIL